MAAPIRPAGPDSALSPISIPIAGASGSLEQSLRIERAVRSLPGVRSASIDLAAGELVLGLDSNSDPGPIQKLLAAAGWETGASRAEGTTLPDPVQKRAARSALVRALLVTLAAVGASVLAIAAGPRAIAPAAAWISGLGLGRLRLDAQLAHALLASLSAAAIALGGHNLGAGALKDLRKRAVTSRLLASIAILTLFVSSLVASLLGIARGDSAPLFYSGALWTLSAILWSVAILETRRGAGEGKLDDLEEPLRSRARETAWRSALFRGKPSARGLLEASRWPVAILVAAVATLATWLVVDPLRWPVAILAFATILVAGVPAAFALAPAVLARSSVLNLARAGILVPGEEALEKVAATSRLVTTLRGGVTRPELEVTDFLLLDGIEAGSLLAWAAGDRTHPIAEAIRARRRTQWRDPAPPPPPDLAVGNSDQLGLTDLRGIEGDLQRLESDGKTVVLVASRGELLGAVALASPFRQSAAESIARLREMGVETILASGSSEGSTEAVASRAGTARYASGLDPEGKGRLVEALRDDPSRPVVAVLSDAGDRPAHDRADVAIVMSAELPQSAGQISVAREDFTAIADLFDQSRRTHAASRARRAALIAYHCAALPIVAALPLTGMLPSPFVAAALAAIITWRSSAPPKASTRESRIPGRKDVRRD